MSARRARLGTAAVAALLALAAANSIVTVERTEIDPVTGSIRRQTRWLGLLPSPFVVDPSPLANWLAEHGDDHRPTWMHLSTVRRGLDGRAIVRGCSVAPPIYALRPFSAQIVQTFQDYEMRSFLNAMGSGTFVTQEAAVLDAQKRIEAGRMSRPDEEAHAGSP